CPFSPVKSEEQAIYRILNASPRLKARGPVLAVIPYQHESSGVVAGGSCSAAFAEFLSRWGRSGQITGSSGPTRHIHRTHASTGGRRARRGTGPEPPSCFCPPGRCCRKPRQVSGVSRGLARVPPRTERASAPW